MMDMIKKFTTILLFFIVMPGSAHPLTRKAGYDALDTAQIRKILSEPVNFSEENIDTLSRKFQLLYSRSNSLGFWWGRMKSSSLLGFAYEMNGNNELSLMCFARAILIANERKEFNQFLPDIYVTISAIYRTREEYSKMIELLGKCEQYVKFYKSNYAKTDLNNDLFDIYSMRALAYTSLNLIPDAQKTLNLAVQMISENQKVSLLQEMKINLSRFYIEVKQKRYRICENLISKNLAIA